MVGTMVAAIDDMVYAMVDWWWLMQWHAMADAIMNEMVVECNSCWLQWLIAMVDCNGWLQLLLQWLITMAGAMADSMADTMFGHGSMKWVDTIVDEMVDSNGWLQWSIQ